MPRLFPFACFFAVTLSVIFPNLVAGQDASSSPTPVSPENPGTPTSPEKPAPPFLAPPVAPLKLDIARRDLKNFLSDETVLASHRSSAGDVLTLREVFMVGSANVARAFFWDPASCRLLGVIALDAPETTAPVGNPTPGTNVIAEDTPTPPSPYVLKAAGAMPLSSSAGASGSPRYFGFRLVGGMPEFLYTLGSLAVEERLWLDEGGTVLKQRFAVPSATQGIKIVIPEDWKKRAIASSGTWQENVLSVPKENSAEIILSYRLTDVEPESSESN